MAFDMRARCMAHGIYLTTESCAIHRAGISKAIQSQHHHVYSTPYQSLILVVAVAVVVLVAMEVEKEHDETVRLTPITDCCSRSALLDVSFPLLPTVHPRDSDGDETFGLERGDNRKESISNCYFSLTPKNWNR
jgi:hypothetical protein